MFMEKTALPVLHDFNEDGVGGGLLMKNFLKFGWLSIHRDQGMGRSEHRWRLLRVDFMWA